jgi:elongation factor P
VATTADFKNGLVLKIDNKLQQITEFQHVKPGKGPAFVRTKLKDVVSGKVIDKTFNAGVKVETATVDRRDMDYLYNDGENYVVMDQKTFEQYEVPQEKFGDAGRFLKDGMKVQLSFHDGEILFAELPVSVDLVIEHDRPGSAGRPLHRRHQARHPRDRRRDPGPAVPRDRQRVVKVDTRSGEYLSRVNN